MPVYPFTKVVNSDKLAVELVAAGITGFVINTSGATCGVAFADDLSSENQAILSAIVSNHVPLTTAEGLAKYLETTVYPFVKSLINSFAAENISSGITQAGKTGHVLSLFTKRFPVPNVDFPNSLKSAMDTGSLYLAKDIIQHIRDTPTEFTGLDPFITDAKLLAMKNKIETFLGVTLST